MPRCLCPKAGPKYPGEAADLSHGVPGCIVLLGANLWVPGSSGDRGNIPTPAQMQPHTSRGPREFLSRAVWRPPHVAKLAPPGQGCALRSLSSHEMSGGTVLAPGVQRAVTLGRTPCAESRWTASRSLLSGRNATYPACSLLPLPPSHEPGRMKEVWELCAHRGDDSVEDTLSCGALCRDRNIAACFKEGGPFQEC